MLVLTRKPGESIIIGDEIVIQVVEAVGRGRNARIKIGITAPKELPIFRTELLKDKPIKINRRNP